VFVIHHAPVAQLDRASGFEPAGRRFNSCRAHQSGIRVVVDKGLFMSGRLLSLAREFGSYLPVP
jgi:hypothetical protein